MIAFATPDDEPDEELDLHSATDAQLIDELRLRFDELVVIGRQQVNDDEVGMVVTHGCQLRISALLQMAADGVFEDVSNRYWVLSGREPVDDED